MAGGSSLHGSGRPKSSSSYSGRGSPVSSPLSSRPATEKQICIEGCKNPVTDKQKALLCDFCEKWSHLECDDRMTVKMYSEMHRSPSDAILYICKICRDSFNTSRSKTANCIGLGLQHEDTLLEIKTMVANIEKRVNYQEESLASLDNKIIGAQANSYAEVVKSTKQINDIAKRVEKSVNIQEGLNRKVNVILFQLKEDDSKSLESVLGELLDDMSLQSKVKSSQRLGRKVETSGEPRPRPVKVSFSNEEDKWNFLKRLNHLKPKGVFGKLDLTQEERDREKTLVDKLKSIRQETPAKTYKIKNWAVVEVTSQGTLETVFKLSTQT